jgi:hypothetical protein
MLEAAVLVLVMRGIYDIGFEMTSCGMMYKVRFIKIGAGVQ